MERSTHLAKEDVDAYSSTEDGTEDTEVVDCGRDSSNIYNLVHLHNLYSPTTSPPQPQQEEHSAKPHGDRDPANVVSVPVR